MLATDLAAEWQRATTADNAESFLQKHGGKDKVFADPDLKQAYERRLQIRNDFLDLMREGYKRFKLMPPFDKGAKAEAASPTVKQPVLAAMALRCIPLSPEAARQWPSFRGPTGQGHARETDFHLEWTKDGRNIVWRVDVPGKGNSSPIVWGDRIFLTSSDDAGQDALCIASAAAMANCSGQPRPRPLRPSPASGIRTASLLPHP